MSVAEPLDGGPPEDERLDAEQLGVLAGTSSGRIKEMVAAGILRPDSKGAFRRGDLQRVTVAEALAESGLSVELLRRGIEAGVVSFELTDALYPYPGPLGPSVSDVAADMGIGADTLVRVIMAFGLPRPEPWTRLHEPDVAHLRAFVAAWRPLGDDEVVVRAARGYGDAIRRAAEGWMGIFEEVVMAPLATRAVPWEEMRSLAFEPGMRLLEAGRSMLLWLLDQHLFTLLNQQNLDAIERQLDVLGIAPLPPRRPSAVVFLDLAGYTRLTEERGDEAAAASATRLAALADEVARRHDGRLVKALGDGVMLHFERPSEALASAVELRDAMYPAGLPPSHTGIDAGRVIRRESDLFGRTVNVAARLAAAAGPDEILLTDRLVDAVRAGGGRLPKLVETGPLQLKGIPEPVPAFRVEH